MRRDAARTRLVLLRAVSSAWIHRAITAACGLVVLPIVTSRLGPVDFGVWVLSGQLASFLTLTDAGSGTAVSRLVARARGSGEPKAVGAVLSVTFAMTVGSALLTIPLAIVAAAFLPSWLQVPGPTAADMRTVLLIGGASLALQSCLRVGSGILAGFQMYGLHALAKVLEPVFTLGGVVVLATTGALDLVSLAAVSAGSVLTAQTIQFVVAWRATRPWALSWRLIDRDGVRDVFSLGGSLVLSSIGVLVHHQGLGVLVGKVVGVESAGLYGLALAVITNLQPLIHALATPMTTLASEWEASRARSTLHQTLQSVTTVTSGLGGVVMLGTFAFAAPVVRLFLGSDGWTASSVQTAAHALAIMGIGVWCGAITLPLRSVMQGTGRHWLVMRVQTGASLAGLALGAGLLASGAGVPGAAAAWTCVWAVQWFATAAATRLDPALGGLFGWAVLASTVRSGLATLIAAVTLQRLLGAPGSIAGTLAAIGLSAGAGGLATFWPWLEQLARQRRRRAADGR